MMPSNFRRGSVLILVLWMVILLGILTLSYTSSVRTQLQITQAARNRREAYWAARAGIEKARSVLLTTPLKGVTPGKAPFFDPEDFQDQKVGEASFTVWIADEAGKVNINGAEYDQLILLKGMTPERVQCLLDWRDSDRRARPMGAEDDYYMSLRTPYHARNAPFLSDRELMRVKGWDKVFQKAFPDPFGRLRPPSVDMEVSSDEEEMPMSKDEARILLGSLTPWSVATDGKAPDGEAKMNLNQADAAQMTRRIKDLADEDAAAIVEYRKTKAYSSVFDLLDVTSVPGAPAGKSKPTPTPRPTPPPRNAPTSSRSSSSSNSSAQSTPTPSPTGPVKVFSLDELGRIVDYFTAQSSQSSSGGPKPGLVNINTAGREALLTLPQMTEEMADTILQQRDIQAFEYPGAIASLPGMNEAIFKKMYPLVQTESKRFHLYSGGWSGGGGDAANSGVNLEAVVEVGDNFTDIVYWRER